MINSISKSFLIFITTLALALTIARLALPTFLIYYAEKRINKIPEYHATIRDIDVQLLQGSYTIKNLVLQKVNGRIPVPFFSADKIILSVQWKALLHGAFVAKLIALQPIVNFVVEPNQQNEQLTIDKEWEYVVKALFPLNFNSVVIKDGSITLQSFKGKPPFKLALHDINFSLNNLQQVTRTDKALFSTFSGEAYINQGIFTINGRVNPFAQQPTFMLSSALKSMQIKGANDLLLHFTHIDVQEGEFSLYSELAAAHGKITGYAKPLSKNLKIFDPKKIDNPIEFLYKGATEIGAKILTNQKKQTIATKIKINGDIDNPKTSVFSIIGYLLRNAFIQALLPQIDKSVEMRDIVVNNKTAF